MWLFWRELYDAQLLHGNQLYRSFAFLLECFFKDFQRSYVTLLLFTRWFHNSGLLVLTLLAPFQAVSCCTRTNSEFHVRLSYLRSVYKSRHVTAAFTSARFNAAAVMIQSIELTFPAAVSGRRWSRFSEKQQKNTKSAPANRVSCERFRKGKFTRNFYGKHLHYLSLFTAYQTIEALNNAFYVAVYKVTPRSTYGVLLFKGFARHF